MIQLVPEETRVELVYCFLACLYYLVLSLVLFRYSAVGNATTLMVFINSNDQEAEELKL